MKPCFPVRLRTKLRAQLSPWLTHNLYAGITTNVVIDGQSRMDRQWQERGGIRNDGTLWRMFVSLLIDPAPAIEKIRYRQLLIRRVSCH